jgi:FKBP-type peptidyl-prolyl cis-trans isomerase
MFDSSVQRNEPFTFVVNDKGKYGVIPGWNEAIKKMRKGSIATIIVPSSLAYGEQGRGKIPPYCPLKFEIQLLEIK